MEISLNQLIFFIAAISFALGISAIILYARASSRRKNIETMPVEMAKKPVSVLVEELEKKRCPALRGQFCLNVHVALQRVLVTFTSLALHR